ncbi:hypothetical protein ACFLS1_09220 [Verrucomicrobiota bacterium]
MKKTIQLILLLGLAASGSGCATPYMIDRGRDAADIVTAGVGMGLGAKARVGPIQAGLLADMTVVGFRGGDVVGMEYGVPIGGPCDYQMFAWGIDFFPGVDPPRNKAFCSRNLCYYIPFVYMAEGDKDMIPLYYYTQIELVVDLGVGFRLGFNPGELLDFILGWTTLDIFNDDLEWKKRKSNNHKRDISKHKNP